MEKERYKIKWFSGEQLPKIISTDFDNINQVDNDIDLSLDEYDSEW